MRHFTLNRTWKGTDHGIFRASSLQKLIRELNNTHKSLKTKKGNGILKLKEIKEKTKTNVNYLYVKIVKYS